MAILPEYRKCHFCKKKRHLSEFDEGKQTCRDCLSKSSNYQKAYYKEHKQEKVAMCPCTGIPPISTDDWRER